MELKHSANVRTVSWSTTGDRILSVSDASIIWDATTGVRLLQMEEATCAWSPDGEWVACGNDKTIAVRNATTGDRIMYIMGHSGSICSVDWNPNGKEIVSGGLCAPGRGSAGEIFVWNAESGDKVLELKGHCDGVTAVVWSPKGDQIASGSFDASVIVWDATSGGEVSVMGENVEYVLAVDWSPKGDKIVSGSGHDGRTCEWMRKVNLFPTIPGSHENVLIIWEAATGGLSMLQGHTAGVTSVAWSPCGDRIVSGAKDGLVIVWDAATGEKLAELKGHSEWVRDVAWSPDGHKIAVASGKTVRIWEGGVSRPLAVAMALHRRLGGRSPLAALDCPLVQAIVRLMPLEWTFSEG